jgi:hypothetical protein
MTGVNKGRDHTLEYEAQAEAIIKRDDQGRFIEEFRWTRLSMGTQEIALDDKSRSFRQHLSLDPNVEMSPPDISGLHPLLIGPVFDLMTFYVDANPSLHQGQLRKAGETRYVAHGQPNSWADGTNVVLGQDCIDFDLTLKAVNGKTAVLQVRHVPPKQGGLEFPAQWMHERLNPDVPNNWVQVQRDTTTTPPRFVAAAGHEVFDVLIELEQPSGIINSASMDNPVEVMQRHCSDEQLTDCGEPTRYQIRRQIHLRRVVAESQN